MPDGCGGIKAAWRRAGQTVKPITGCRTSKMRSGFTRLNFIFCGAAWMAMTLQAGIFGLFTHGMGGIEREETYGALNVPKADWEVVCGFTLSEVDKPELLPDDLRAREFPSPRKPLSEIWKKGRL